MCCARRDTFWWGRRGCFFSSDFAKSNALKAKRNSGSANAEGIIGNTFLINNKFIADTEFFSDPHQNIYKMWTRKRKVKHLESVIRKEKSLVLYIFALLFIELQYDNC